MSLFWDSTHSIKIIYQALNIPFPQKYVNFKFYRLNQQEKNYNQLTWIVPTNEGTPYNLILQFMI